MTDFTEQLRCADMQISDDLLGGLFVRVFAAFGGRDSHIPSGCAVRGNGVRRVCGEYGLRMMVMGGKVGKCESLFLLKVKILRINAVFCRFIHYY